MSYFNLIKLFTNTYTICNIIAVTTNYNRIKNAYLSEFSHRFYRLKLLICCIIEVHFKYHK